MTRLSKYSLIPSLIPSVWNTVCAKIGCVACTFNVPPLKLVCQRHPSCNTLDEAPPPISRKFISHVSSYLTCIFHSRPLRDSFQPNSSSLRYEALQPPARTARTLELSPSSTYALAHLWADRRAVRGHATGVGAN